MTCGGCFKNGLIKDVNETRGRFMVTSAGTWDQKSELESYQSKFRLTIAPATKNTS